MDDSALKNTVTRYRLTASVGQQRIRAAAIESGNVKWSLHALTRMNEREIFDVDVLRVLRGGFIGGEPERTPTGEWKCKMTLRVRGSREVGVVTIILKGGMLLIKTVEWEDLS